MIKAKVAFLEGRLFSS